MTGTQLSSILGLRLEDSAESVFTEAMKVDAINVAQRTVVSMVNNAYLSELEEILEGQAIASTGVTFATAGIDPIRGGLIAVYDSTHSKFCTKLEGGHLFALNNNTYLNGTENNPIYWVFNENIWVRPSSCTLINIWYLKAPTNYIAGAITGQCELDPALQDIVLDFAEAQLWRMDAKPEKGAAAYTNALNTIKTLNDRYITDKAQAIDQAGR